MSICWVVLTLININKLDQFVTFPNLILLSSAFEDIKAENKYQYETIDFEPYILTHYQYLFQINLLQKLKNKIMVKS
jgi:hypothetical protein